MLIYCITIFKKTSLKRTGSSYIVWLKNNKTINLKNNDDNCFQYVLTVALNYQNFDKNPQRISKTKPFINQYDWKSINIRSHKEDCKKFESSNKSIALNILFVPYNTKEIRLACKSIHNFNMKKYVMIMIIVA